MLPNTYHPGNFKKFIPLAPKFNARVVLVNRRDYPGSAPFTSEERAEFARLASAPAGAPGAAEAMELIMKERARELYDFCTIYGQVRTLLHYLRTYRRL